MNDSIKFCCAACGGALEPEAGGWKCAACAAFWPIRDGIPFFSGREYYFADVPEPEMDRLLAETAARGWKPAAHDFLRRANPGSYKLAGDESRSDWKFIFPLTRESSVLDLGCGFGSIAFSLSRRCGKVAAMDISAKRLKYVSLRAAQEKTANIFPVFGGDAPRLPFPDGSFDLVVLNGVLEWLGLFGGDKDPRDVQLEKLREIHRVLKPGGSVYIGIENRTGYVYFFGGTDHGGTRFTTLMPRFMADLVSRLTGRGPYRTYTYTEAGYRRLLAEAGFGKADFYATIPSYRDVYFLAPLGDARILDHFFARLFQVPSLRRRILRAGARLLLKLGVFRYFVPEMGIAVRK
ncbi:MAG TPA: hypothetical protein DCZ93_08245 [Elusimicrobia bacterium]|nr:hypothetical protein [Elusimicrobiota bacterium]